MATVGIIGAGQLGQMLGIAGRHLGIDCVFLDPAENPPARGVGEVIRLPFDSAEGLAQLAERCDVVTYEFENVPVDALSKLPADLPVYPPPAALRNAQDRLMEKTLFCSLDIPVPGFRAVDSVADLEAAAGVLGLPLVLKTRRLGYDGKGQQVVRGTHEMGDAIAALGGKQLIAEQWVAFDREVSAIGARSVSGEIAWYPLTENVHAGGILSTSRAPADAEALEDVARAYLERLLERLDYVGVLALELFVTGGRLLANEFAPRVHNSGHWTIEGSRTSQFENHLRAILDMPLGDTGMQGQAGMVNLIGRIPANRVPFEGRNRHLHDYGKEPRPGRKLGHVTVVTRDPHERDRVLKELANHLNS
ncbi:MAG: 5-(carboxyamino)imidazole ribonucleotide synthase [Gammaproteobacteria bacterium]|nr:5-(carboxyamino)imidazole ribonucleotide synthase [Gammaproteobacteria bacterium]MDH5344827.1 5-(carboxyamino)imidazole ribonucleotide synthase [Gammaproteobacteria bacterium]